MQRKSKKIAAAVLASIAIGAIGYFVSRESALLSETERDAALSAEAVSRVRSFLDYTVSSIDPETSLFPRDRAGAIWAPRDNAADDYPYAVIAAKLFGKEDDLHALERVLESERSVTIRENGLVDDYDFDKGRFFLPRDPERLLLNNAEYAKDGLLPIVDALGKDSPWTERLISIIDSIWDAKQLWSSETLPSSRLETNGDLLQVLSRLYWLTGDEEYLEKARGIADHYLLTEPLVASGTPLQLRDHANEVIVGLSELYFAFDHADKNKTVLYRKPLRDLYEAVLEEGRTDEGLVLSSAGGDALTDNWGYIMNAIRTVADIEDDEGYRAETVRTAEAVASLGERVWEERYPFDGYADTIESAIMTLSYYPAPPLFSWVAENMERLWKLEDSLVSKGPNYLYGNVARTNMLYALMKSKGFTLEPWPENGGLAAKSGEDGIELFIYLPPGSEWKGILKASPARHSTIWSMPSNYPRINALLEWFVPNADVEYALSSGPASERSKVTGARLLEGVALELSESGVIEIAPARLGQNR
ncbi:MAG: hypothetical protein HZA81_03535 [Candidatus Taylorbacteria bacterium]|nr:hypothetical protein [Candidatus Taylorbacteria bacterium]